MTPTNREVENVLAILKGYAKSFEVVFTWVLEVLAILKGSTQGSHTLKRQGVGGGGGGQRRFNPVLRGGGGVTKFRTANFPIL